MAAARPESHKALIDLLGMNKQLRGDAIRAVELFWEMGEINFDAIDAMGRLDNQRNWKRLLWSARRLHRIGKVDGLTGGYLRVIQGAAYKPCPELEEAVTELYRDHFRDWLRRARQLGCDRSRFVRYCRQKLEARNPVAPNPLEWERAAFRTFQELEASRKV